MVGMISFAAGFYSYGGARTMAETFTFDLAASLYGLLLGVVIPVLFVGPIAAGKKLWGREKLWPPSALFLLFASSLLVGSLISECWILMDEARFAGEVSRSAGTNLFSRPRAWPNELCSLVFVPGKGIHSTD